MALKGFDFLIFLGTGATATIIGGSKSCSFDTKKEKIDTSSRDGKSFLLGQEEYSISTDGVADFTPVSGVTNLSGVTAFYKNETTINWSFGSASSSTYPQTLNQSKTFYSGIGKITEFKVSSNSNGAVEYSLKIDGIGTWTQT